MSDGFVLGPRTAEGLKNLLRHGPGSSDSPNASSVDGNRLAVIKIINGTANPKTGKVCTYNTDKGYQPTADADCVVQENQDLQLVNGQMYLGRLTGTVSGKPLYTLEAFREIFFLCETRLSYGWKGKHVFWNPVTKAWENVQEIKAVSAYGNLQTGIRYMAIMCGWDRDPRATTPGAFSSAFSPAFGGGIPSLWCAAGSGGGMGVCDYSSVFGWVSGQTNVLCVDNFGCLYCRQTHTC